ncbi:MAG: DUF1552 domain-containing protein [Myxococcaceae bacterium]|nr:DUF1552 domain-containing protein [Myxococcaceae bacterium]
MRLSRRRLLLGASGAALALPPLEAFAQAAPVPKRLVLLFTANGTLYEQWAPADAAKPAGSPILAPLAPHAADLLPITNLEVTSAKGGLGDDHGRGIAHLWTGTAMVGQPRGPDPWWAGGPSVDQVAARTLGKDTALASLELAVQPRSAAVFDRMISAGAGQPVPPEVDPLKVFDRLFGARTATPDELRRRRERRTSVLDFVRGELSSLKQQVGRADALRLEAHAESVRAVERRLALLAQAPACAPFARPNAVDVDDPAQFEALGRLQLDLLALALTCDLTRVGSVQYSGAASPVVYRWLGCTVEHHELSHRADGDADAAAQLLSICTWSSGEVKRLLDALAAVTERDGQRLLDHTVVAWGNELGKGNTHSHARVPFVLAGGRALGLAPGRVVDATGHSHNDLLLSLLQAVGVQASSFGDAAFCKGPLPGLTG